MPFFICQKSFFAESRDYLAAIGPGARLFTYIFGKSKKSMKLHFMIRDKIIKEKKR